jgi:hypothetical protein
MQNYLATVYDLSIPQHWKERPPPSLLIEVTVPSKPCAPRRVPDFLRGPCQLAIVFRMLPMCASMWPIRPLVMSCSTVIGGASVKTVPLIDS